MKILVTGANGYIGSKVCSFLDILGHKVIACDISNSHLNSKIKFINFDIFSDLNIDLFEFFGKPDVCLHLAWRDGFIHSSDRHMLDLSLHYAFLNNLLKHGLKNVAIMGTMHEIGYFEGCVTENTPCNPTNQYGIAKNALRESSALLCKKYEAFWKWLRAFYIYGDDSFGNSIFCKLRKAAADGVSTFDLTSGEKKFDFINVNDLAKLISYSILQIDINGIINVSTGKPVSLKDMILKYTNMNNISINLNWGAYPERESESPCIYGDNTKISKVLSSVNKRGNLNV